MPFYMTPTMIVAVLIICMLLLDRIVCRGLLSKWLSGFGKSKWRFLVYGIMIFMFYIFNFQRIHFDSRPSPVDVSPIARLTTEQIDRLEEVLDFLVSTFDDHDYLIHFGRSEGLLHHNWTISYGFTFGYRIHNHVSGNIRLYRCEQHLISRLPFWHRQLRFHASTEIINDNNTHVFLHASHVERSHGRPVPFRRVLTEIRLGNVHITLDEQRERREVRHNVSSDFIQFLYELLTVEE